MPCSGVTLQMILDLRLNRQSVYWVMRHPATERFPPLTWTELARRALGCGWSSTRTIGRRRLGRYTGAHTRGLGRCQDAGVQDRGTTHAPCRPTGAGLAAAAAAAAVAAAVSPDPRRVRGHAGSCWEGGHVGILAWTRRITVDPIAVGPTSGSPSLRPIFINGTCTAGTDSRPAGRNAAPLAGGRYSGRVRHYLRAAHIASSGTSCRDSSDGMGVGGSVDPGVWADGGNQRSTLGVTPVSVVSITRVLVVDATPADTSCRTHCRAGVWSGAVGR